MKSVVATSLLAFAALCTAQFGNLPSCAKPCANTLPSNCNLSVKCICADASFISGISCCVKKACPVSDQEKTLQVAKQICDTVSVTLPSEASCPASDAPSGASSAAAGGGSTAASAVSSATNMASSAASTVGANASSAVSGASNAVMSATGSPTSPATSSTATTAATGAAQVLGSNMGAVGAAVAAIALL